MRSKASIPEPVIDRKIPSSVNNYYDSLIKIEGDVVDADRITKRLENLSIKIADQRIERSWRECSDELKSG